MKKKLFVLLTTVMLLLLVSVSAVATPPDNASGTWTYRPLGDVLLKEAGGNIFLWNVEEAIWTGTFEGDSMDSGVVVIHNNESVSFNGEVVFETATVDGKTGNLELRVNGTKPDLSPDTEWKGHWVISEAGGELAGLKGQGSWWGPGWGGDPEIWGHIDYDGKIHFE